MDVIIHWYLDYLTPPFWKDELRAVSFAVKRVTGYYFHPTFWVTLIVALVLYCIIFCRRQHGDS